MKVLCVNNGEWLPEQRELGDLKAMLRGFVAAAQDPVLLNVCVYLFLTSCLRGIFICTYQPFRQRV